MAPSESTAPEYTIEQGYKVLHGFWQTVNGEKTWFGGNASSEKLAALPATVLEHLVATGRVKQYNVRVEKGKKPRGQRANAPVPTRAAKSGGRRGSRSRAKGKKDTAAASPPVEE